MLSLLWQMTYRNFGAVTLTAARQRFAVWGWRMLEHANQCVVDSGRCISLPLFASWPLDVQSSAVMSPADSLPKGSKTVGRVQTHLEVGGAER